MKFRRTISAGLIGALLAILPGVSAAQEAPPPIVTQPAPMPEHFDLHDAMNDAFDNEAAIDAGLEAMQRELANDPTLGQLESMSPGLIAEYAASTKPILAQHSKRVQDMYRPRMAILFARHLTAQEASSAADFYRSAIGRRMMKSMSRNFSVDSVLDDFDDEAPISSEDIATDLETTVTSTFEEMSPEEMAEFLQAVMQNPALRKLGAMQGDIRELRVLMENEPMLPEAQRQIEMSMVAIIERRFPDF